MKIYYYSGATLPSNAAKSVHVMKMCAAWARQKHDVHLFGKGYVHNRPEIFKYYGVAPDFEIETAKNIKTPILSGMVRLYYFHARLHELGQPHLAYGRDPVALRLLGQPETPTVYEAHQMPYVRGHLWAVPELIKLPGFRGIVAISEGLKRDLLDFYQGILPEEKVFVAHDGADIPEKKAGPATLQGRGAAVKVGYTGSLHPGKGADFLVRLAKSCPDFDFHIVGGDKDQVRKMKKIAADNVHFYGHVPHADLPGYLEAFDILAAPYQEKATIKTGQDISRWISPMKLFEYMAAEKPILSSDLPVIREILTEGENALLAPPADEGAWIAQLNVLKHRPEKGKTLATQALKDLKSKYTWDQRAKNILKFCTQNS